MKPQSAFYDGPAFRVLLGMIRTNEFLGPTNLEPFYNTCHPSNLPFALLLLQVKYHFNHGISTHFGTRSGWLSVISLVVAYLYDLRLVMGEFLG